MKVGNLKRKKFTDAKICSIDRVDANAVNHRKTQHGALVNKLFEKLRFLFIIAILGAHFSHRFNRLAHLMKEMKGASLAVCLDLSCIPYSKLKLVCRVRCPCTGYS